MKRWKIIILTGAIIFVLFSLFNLQRIQNVEGGRDGVSISLPLHKGNDSDSGIIQTSSKGDNQNVYELDLRKWGIFNDGTHPIETTKGLNAALEWTQQEGYTTFYVPAGTYLISKGEGVDDPDSRINIVSNITFLLDDKAIIQKESNGFEIYSTLYIDSEIENVTIKGGTIRGDRETHDYSQKGEYTGGTHEWGNGIDTKGAQNVIIDGVKIEKFTGDGIEIGGSTIYGDYITGEDIEIGGINENGKLIHEKGKVRTKNYDVTNFNHPVYENPHYRNIMMWIPEGVEGNYDIFFYRKDQSFIRADSNLRFNSTWGYSEIPDDADYFKAVFNSNSTENIEVNKMTVAITKNITIQNCDIGYNRRQGITVGASDGVNILNNRIHHTNGIAPESGIDIEPGFYPAINTNIKGNQFLNNTIHMVFAYGGKAVVEDNYFGPNVQDGIGFAINPAYYGAIIKNNQFDHSDFSTWGNTHFSNNKLVASSATFEGGDEVTIESIDALDSNLDLNQTVIDGIKVKDITLNSSGKRDITSGIYVYGEPIQMNNIKLNGSNEISGDGNSYNIYENITFNQTPEMNLASGIYKSCLVKSGHFSLNNPGKIEMNNCKFVNTTFYTYNTETVAIFQHSSFENDIIDGPIILALEAKTVNVLNNTFKVDTAVEPTPIIQIGRDASEHVPTKVFNTTIKGNTINSKYSLIGIDTMNGGIGSSPYIIEDNTLLKAKLNLRKNDVNRNNQLKNN
ncbi:right-handed parallel beta-helix repeat-containing protein [Lederbergia panacisoli]|uniref:right-handed parallel beta-helix repeat-containing protein n=1 Tax=Lederbergia panacisoli TaxID=1255251 RepID=UPI00214B6423|nr:right-handed parallel beta-helix repeat-containing protein [Lederbergia panacisoli]MCR2822006.1 right-handed parallel beta-helix repeat-containing protein [Lederbergia panacisoli]